MIITRNVDLSVGSVLGLTAYLTGRLFIDHPGIPIVVVVLAGLLAGAVLGLVNGLLVGFGRVPALVITLGTLYIYRGVVLTWAGSNRINASDMPNSFGDLGTATVLVDPGPVPGGAGRAARRSATTCTRPAAVASSTRSAPTRTPPCSTGCASGAA